VRTEQLCREFGLPLRHTVFPLHPETPEPGIGLADLFAGRGYDLEALFERLKTVASEVGVEMGERTRTYNSRRAQELGKWAEEQGAGDAFRMAIFRAYFVEGRNIARPEELAAITGSIDLDPDEALRVIADRRFAGAVDGDWQRARDLGITAVPTLLYGDRRLVGFTPYETMRRFILG